MLLEEPQLFASENLERHRDGEEKYIGLNAKFFTVYKTGGPLSLGSADLPRSPPELAPGKASSRPGNADAMTNVSREIEGALESCSTAALET